MQDSKQKATLNGNNGVSTGSAGAILIHCPDTPYDSSDEGNTATSESGSDNGSASGTCTRVDSRTSNSNNFARVDSQGGQTVIEQDSEQEETAQRRVVEQFVRRGSEIKCHLFASRRLKSFSHDGIASRALADVPLDYHYAVRSTTQETSRIGQLHHHSHHHHENQLLRSPQNDSPDLINSRQLRRRVARYSSSEIMPKDEEEAIISTACSNADMPDISILGSLKNAAFSSWLNILIIFVPLGYIAHFLNWPVVAVFVLNYLAIIPLSALMGFATEEVSIRLGRTWGSVVNACFGNAVELIVAVIALIEEEYRIVQAGLIGSVLSNTLLVLGCAFFAGGLHHRVQIFHAEAAQCAGALLALSVLSMIIPAAYHDVHASGGEITNGILIMSRGTALILLLVYILFLVFQLKTHSDIFDGSHTRRGENSDIEEYAEALSPNLGLNIMLDDTKGHGRGVFSEASCRSIGGSSGGFSKRRKWRSHTHECHLRHSAPQMRLWIASALLVIISVLVAFSSDILVDSVQELTSHYNISHTFVGMILLPIAASAAEHTMSITVAIRDKMDLCITVAVGSSMQMTLFVLPTLIIIAWIMKRPLTLFFDEFETTTMLISVLVINYLIMNGRSNWLKGAMLLSSYFIVAMAFFLYPADVDNPKGGIDTQPTAKSGLF
ncbi:hypothetical protein GGI25_002760 [Coemansia spiralis]|uniref:Sodium/calcium exchanger membrane region domain-containing protein n=1 Tax=Coemansia spiralis TaxID=417178 RepID=A0A9W8KYR7_9FUNG|nr:hypothetical protein GGI26_000733 [Coemansia sp. RSA 1358]KAJ2677970.1 hypothetical protein GGI25_002760 [Coemansia spiralis]